MKRPRTNFSSHHWKRYRWHIPHDAKDCVLLKIISVKQAVKRQSPLRSWHGWIERGRERVSSSPGLFDWLHSALSSCYRPGRKSSHWSQKSQALRAQNRTDGKALSSGVALAFSVEFPSLDTWLNTEKQRIETISRREWIDKTTSTLC